MHSSLVPPWMHPVTGIPRRLAAREAGAGVTDEQKAPAVIRKRRKRPGFEVQWHCPLVFYGPMNTGVFPLQLFWGKNRKVIRDWNGCLQNDPKPASPPPVYASWGKGAWATSLGPSFPSPYPRSQPIQLDSLFPLHPLNRHCFLCPISVHGTIPCAIYTRKRGLSLTLLSYHQTPISN